MKLNYFTEATLSFLLLITIFSIVDGSFLEVVVGLIIFFIFYSILYFIINFILKKYKNRE